MTPGLEAVLALEREAGTAGAADARALLTRELEALGYEVVAQRFAFSTGTLNALPVLGGGLGWLTLLQIPLLLLPAVPGWAALAVLLAGLACLVLVARAIGTGAASSSGELREDANLVATRPGAPPARWLVAHLDTKAQGHSMAGRLVAVWLLLAAVVALGALAVWRLSAVPPMPVAAAAAAASVMAGFLAGRGRLKGRTVGARDNGSGLVALMEGAAHAAPSTGVIITSAEEFGLVGARILAQQRGELVRGRDVLNLDTIDDRGDLAIVLHDPPGDALAVELEGLLAGVAPRVRRRRLPLGIFVDSYPLARAGARAVTIGRLNWATLRLIHTPRDTREGLAFDTARAVGERLGRLG
ncbi:MAG TPA: M28 family peptidase [Gemmatimonadales bacterium]|nr:M28 family peptidase [Gemmatimonadales bacterium]